jgi:hypothetical protein
VDEKEILVESPVTIVDAYQLPEIPKELYLVPERIRQTFPFRISPEHLEIALTNA